jgi:hypothetical protein
MQKVLTQHQVDYFHRYLYYHQLPQVQMLLTSSLSRYGVVLPQKQRHKLPKHQIMELQQSRQLPHAQRQTS